MDTDELVAHIKSRFDHESQKRILREKYEAKMIFAHAGGMWRAGPELHCVLMTCQQEQAVLLDLYDVPVLINVPELKQLSDQRWQEQMNAWYKEWEQLRHQR